MTFGSLDKLIAWLALLSGLSISAVAVYYSVAGLISIFAAAAIPIAIMGIVLELGKLVSTIWLKQNWFIAPRLIKSYLLISTAMLMMITSMGIFGFLSKAHMDQTASTGQVSSQVSLIDEKIKTQRDNIELARKALNQMDAQVDARLSRGDSEQGAERAVQIRRQQAGERTKIQNEIATAQKEIAKLQNEKAPIAAELRKVEAEVGPIKYIAALIYGDENLDQTILEKAVRWVTILIVITFDPLAIVLLLASQHSFNWFKKSNQARVDDDKKTEASKVQITKLKKPTAAPENKEDTNKDSADLVADSNTTQSNEEVAVVKKDDEFDISKHAYLKKPWISKVPQIKKKMKPQS